MSSIDESMDQEGFLAIHHGAAVNAMQVGKYV